VAIVLYILLCSAASLRVVVVWAWICLLMTCGTPTAVTRNWIPWLRGSEPSHQIARDSHLLREHEVFLGVLGDSLSRQLELRRHLGLRITLLGEEMVDVRLHLLPPLLILFFSSAIALSTNWVWTEGLALTFGAVVIARRTQQTESGFTGDRVATNNFVSHDLTNQTMGILRLSQRDSDLEPRKPRIDWL
jgi:hypothetical protein